MAESTQTQAPALSREDQTAQSINAIGISNRLAIAEIRLKRAGRLSDDMVRELKEIRDSVHDLGDSLILGENVRSYLEIIEGRVTQFEERIAT